MCANSQGLPLDYCRSPDYNEAMSSVKVAVDFLRTAQNEDGGWPYIPGQASKPEATCHAVLACALSGEDAAARAGLNWLEQGVGADGAFHLAGEEGPHWTTSLVLYVFSMLDVMPEERPRLIARLLAWEVMRTDTDAMVRLNARLAGWSWNEGTFSWVEPTAYALLALKKAGQGAHPRVLEGVTLLVDRACTGGGWNYGNPEVMQRQLPAFPDPTAWALLALQQSPVSNSLVAAGLDFLAREVPSYPSSLALALGSLALLAWGRSADGLVAALRDRQTVDGSWRQRILNTALAALALLAWEGGPHAFRL